MWQPFAVEESPDDSDEGEERWVSLRDRRYAEELAERIKRMVAEAEAHAARYDYAAAVDRFKAGQDLARRGGPQVDHIEASIIDTRLRAAPAERTKYCRSLRAASR